MPRTKPKDTGLHSLRHFYASWCINRKKDGGLDPPAKIGASQNGSFIDCRDDGHLRPLFPNTDDGSELAEAEKPLLAPTLTQYAT